MAMTTRCPECGTTFKVVPDQLRVRNGLVRCGACTAVFDGRACLVEPAPDDRDTVPVDRPVPVEPSISRPISAPAMETPSPAVLRGRPDFVKRDPYLGEVAAASEADPVYEADEAGTADEVEIADETADEGDDAGRAPPAIDREEEGEDPPVVLGESRTRYHGNTDVGRTPPEFLDNERHARRSWVRSLWGYACVLGVLVLAAQFLFVYRSPLANMAPQLRPLLVQLCEPLGCEIGYARHIDRISIASSSLQPPAGQAGVSSGATSKLVLRASLRNLHDQPQPWPALRLDLSDLSDTVVIRKVLLPETYLPKGQAQPPFEAGAEINITVPIEVNGPRVTGFQLHKFFP